MLTSMMDRARLVFGEGTAGLFERAAFGRHERIVSTRIARQMPDTYESAMSCAADQKFMRLALREAARGAGRTSPNPAVGALIVKAGRVLGKGWHRGAGGPHAEIEALRSLPKPDLARGATLYVTLEPCCTHGRTPPCTAAIVRAGLARVVAGATDPNPRHAGRGFAILKKAGISVTNGVLAGECAALNAAFNKWITTGLPLVIAKAGLSLDGRFTRPRGEGVWLTGAKARADAMRLRAQVDAILVGAGTLRTDDPRLTVRGLRNSGARQPWRVVLTRSGRLPKDARLFSDKHRERTLVFRGKSLRAVLRDLAKRGCTSVMIEGGGALLGSAFDARLVDRVHFYLAPLLCGGPDVIGGLGAGSTRQSVKLANVFRRKIGSDILLRADVRYGA
jgi:diaminohydroxyphosphoribosylaminopyrimidine deaminase/5-amino-6-(5-phosphoribosylamino)uracil reductase